jgi:hypothetical protein
MVHDGSAISDGFSIETPRSSFFQPSSLSAPNMTLTDFPKPSVVEWNWDLEQADRKREAKADSAVHGVQPFLVDRNLLRDVIRERLGYRVGRITFLNSGASPYPPSLYPMIKGMLWVSQARFIKCVHYRLSKVTHTYCSH